MNLTERITEAVKFYKSRYEEEVCRSAKRSRDVTELFSRKRPRGVRYIDAVRRALRGMPLERSEMQIKFHEAFMRACVRLFVRDDPHADIGEIAREQGWDNTKQQVLCLTPRRFGKTYAVAMFAAAVLVSVPRSEQAIFSTGRRASQKMLETIHMFMQHVKPAGLRVLKFNQELIELMGPEGKRSVCSYPSNAKTLRGVGGDILYLEEAAFMSMDVFFEIVTPLLEMQRTALIAISTPQDATNFYSELFDLKDSSGEELFNTMRVSLICDACLESDHPERCPHRKHLIPPWKSDAKLQMVKDIYGDQTQLLQRESMGVITEDASSVFPQDHVEWIFEQEIGPPPTMTPSILFCVCDPTGGGSSRMSLITFMLWRNAVYIVAMDAKRANGFMAVRETLMKHVWRVRKMFRRIRIHFICESNMGQEASHMESMLKEVPMLTTQGEKNRAGVTTTYSRKELYILELQRHVVTRSLFFTEVRGFPGISSECRAILRKELLGFKRLTVENITVQNKFIYTGKQRGQDDTVMALSIGVWWAIKLISGNTHL